MTVEDRFALSRLAALPLLALSLAVPWSGAVDAQEAERGEAAGERLEPAGERSGWIGVGLRAPDCEDEAADGEACPPGLLVELVVVGSPADEAGVQPGDTLLAVEGQEVSEPGQGSGVPTFEPGREMELLLGRSGGRTRVGVTPIRRPEPAGPVAARIWHAAPSRAGEAPAAAGRSGSVRLRVRVESLPPAVLGGSPPEPGAPPPGKIRVPVIQLGDGRTVRLTRRLRAALAGELEGVALPPALEEIRDSVLSLARAQLDSLRQRGVLRPKRRSGEAEGWAPRHRRVLAAGAEFWPLSGGMAESFEGTDRGLLVLRVLPGTPAGELGLRGGDVLTRVDGQEVVRGTDLREALARYPERDSVVVEWVRKGERMTGVMRRR